MTSKVTENVEVEVTDVMPSEIDENGAVSADNAAEDVAPAKTRREVLSEKERSRAARDAKIAESQSKLATRSALETARRNGTVLEGTVIGISPLKYAGESKICATVRFDDGTMISVPFSEMYSNNIMDMSTVDTNTEAGMRLYLNRQRQMMSKMLGQNIPVCILEIFNEAGSENNSLSILASRKKALERIREICFFGRTPRYKVGEVYEGVITSVSPHSLAFNFGGVDVVRQQNVLTTRYVLDLQTYYHAGDKLKFKLEGIEADPKTKEVKLTVNTVAAELQDALARQVFIAPDTLCRCIITRIYNTKDNRINIFGWLPDYELPCKIAFMNANDFGREITSGDECQVYINGYRSSGFLNARVRSLHGNAGLFNLD